MGRGTAGQACRRSPRAPGQGWAPGGDARGRLRCGRALPALRRGRGAQLSSLCGWERIRAGSSSGRSPGSGARASSAGEVEEQPPGPGTGAPTHSPPCISLLRSGRGAPLLQRGRPELRKAVGDGERRDRWLRGRGMVLEGS